MLVDEGSAPAWFDALEYIEWDGNTKDLRWIPGADPEESVIIDDYEPNIHPQQRERWVAIRPFESPYAEDDRELPRIRAILESRLAGTGSEQSEGEGVSGKYQQAAAIPYRIVGTTLEVLLVTSTSGNWILPKGNIDAGNTPAQTAEIEALEEAGVVGSAWPAPVGAYDYEKASIRLWVQVFPLKVEQVLEEWAESKRRSRRWASLAEAIRLVAEPGVQTVLQRYADSEQQAG